MRFSRFPLAILAIIVFLAFAVTSGASANSNVDPTPGDDTDAACLAAADWGVGGDPAFVCSPEWVDAANNTSTVQPVSNSSVDPTPGDDTDAACFRASDWTNGEHPSVCSDDPTGA